jgi:hypothetical protein
MKVPLIAAQMYVVRPGLCQADQQLERHFLSMENGKQCYLMLSTQKKHSFSKIFPFASSIT